MKLGFLEIIKIVRVMGHLLSSSNSCCYWKEGLTIMSKDAMRYDANSRKADRIWGAQKPWPCITSTFTNEQVD